jgi:hypothetical protein
VIRPTRMALSAGVSIEDVLILLSITISCVGCIEK